MLQQRLHHARVAHAGGDVQRRQATVVPQVQHVQGLCTRKPTSAARVDNMMQTPLLLQQLLQTRLMLLLLLVPVVRNRCVARARCPPEPCCQLF
jgi:hypothetical protein